ncbi:MAG: hypothetical protein ACTSYU_13445 [Promethearchaeota archaeon]
MTLGEMRELAHTFGYDYDMICADPDMLNWEFVNPSNDRYQMPPPQYNALAPAGLETDPDWVIRVDLHYYNRYHSTSPKIHVPNLMNLDGHQLHPYTAAYHTDGHLTVLAAQQDGYTWSELNTDDMTGWSRIDGTGGGEMLVPPSSSAEYRNMFAWIAFESMRRTFWDNNDGTFIYGDSSGPIDMATLRDTVRDRMKNLYGFDDPMFWTTMGPTGVPNDYIALHGTFLDYRPGTQTTLPF